MKNLFILFVALGLLAAGSCFGQTSKGRVILGAYSRTNLGIYGYDDATPDIMNVGFSTSKYKSDGNEDDDYKQKITNFNFSPRVGYLVIDNLAIGVDLNIAYLYTSDDNTSSNTSLLTAGPFIRYYIPAGKIYPFLEAGAVFGTLRQYYEYSYSGYNDSSSEKAGISAFGGGAGIAVPIGDHVTFDAMVNYNSSSVKNKEDNTNNERLMTGTFGVKLGFLVYLGK